MTIAPRETIPPQEEEFVIGSDTVFASTLSIFEAGDVQASIRNAFGLPQRLALVDQTPAGSNEFQITDLVPGEGFNIRLNTEARPPGARLVVTNVMEFSQPYSFRESRAYRAEAVEDALDRLAVLAALAETQAGSGVVADGSVGPDQFLADTEDQRKAIRDTLEAAGTRLDIFGFGIITPRAAVALRQ